MDVIRCRGCDEEKTPDQMSKSGSGKRCKVCRNATNNRWLDAPEVRQRAYATNRASQARNRTNQRRHLMELYGVTLERYDEMLAAQDGACRICLEPCSSGKALCVDHCHQCGQVRALLCIRCNAGVGMFRDSSELLWRAVRYLQAVADEGHEWH
jgi:hypothetical protein